ncbi:Mitochondrial ubiquinone biosynthesis protein coq9, partial [Lachnellula suecica]
QPPTTPRPLHAHRINDPLRLRPAHPNPRLHADLPVAGRKRRRLCCRKHKSIPARAFALVHWHLYTQRMALSKLHRIIDPEVSEGSKMPGVGSKVKLLTWERLMGDRDVVHRWQEALALMASPSNIPPSLRELSALSDEIWYLAGDTSVDSSWYTKRASLSSIYAASELFMTTDKSEGYEETRAFMERRFGDVQAVGGAVGSFGQWVGFNARAGLNVLRSKGVRI